MNSVLPHVPIRQWVFTVPVPVRYQLAFDARLTRAVLRVFLPASGGDHERPAGGRIVNISSISGKRGVAYFGAYTFAKFGIVGLTQTLAREVAHLGITVNAVCPGAVETEMLDQIAADRAVHVRPEQGRG